MVVDRPKHKHSTRSHVTVYLTFYELFKGINAKFLVLVFCPNLIMVWAVCPPVGVDRPKH